MSNKTSQYLYGLDPADYINMSYVEAINHKLAAAKQLNRDLHQLSYTDRDEYRVLAIGKAIKHNEMLLDELK